MFATVCTPVFHEERHSMEGPVHIYLERPLEGRAVIDGVTGRPVPYLNVYEDMADDGLFERLQDGSYRPVYDDPGQDDEPWEPCDAP